MDDQTPPIPDDVTGNLHIEVTPLAPIPAMTGGHPQPARPQKRLWRAAVISSVIVIALVVIFSGYLPMRTPLTGWALPQPTGASAREPTPVLLGKVPTDCPPGSSIEIFSPSYPMGVHVKWYDSSTTQFRTLPLWVIGFDGSVASVATAHLRGGGPPTTRGWPLRLGLVAGADIDIAQPITISAHGMGSTGGRVLQFSMDGVDHPTSPLVLVPDKTPPQSGGWRSWLFYIFLPASGCFYIDIQSGAVQTGVGFAAGL